MPVILNRREVEHDLDIAAPADHVYGLIADVANWPRIFPPTLHVEQTAETDNSELIAIWATAVGEVKHWTSRRVLDPQARRIDFKQQCSQSPIASMEGSWIVEPVSDTSARVRLLHTYVADDPAKLQWIDEAVDTNSRSELAALKQNIENETGAADRTITFTDSVRISGNIGDVFAFINDADRWPQRLPHVDAVRLIEPTPGVQLLEMDTRSPDGSTHTTKSHRIMLTDKIAYKQSTLPALMELHTGVWTFKADDAHVVASSQHTAVIREAAIESVLGAAADVAAAKEYVRHALSTNSLATLEHAKRHVERLT